MQQNPLKPLKWSQPLELAARDHSEDLSQSGLGTAIGTDGSLPTDRIARYCNVDEIWAESTVLDSNSAI